MNNANFGTDMGFGMGIGMWLFWIVLILVVFAIARFMMTGSSDTSTESPLQILEKRFSRGEINKDEFESMKKELDK